MANEPTPTAPAPAGATSAAKPISLGQLQQELGAPAAPVKQTFREESAANVTLGDDKGNRAVEPTLPGFRAKAEAMLKEKESAPAEQPAKVEKKAEAPKEAKTEKPAAPEAKKPTDDDVPEDQRKVLPHDKPDTAKRMRFFIKQADEAKKAADAARQELEAAKKAPPSAANTEEVAKLRTEYEAAQADLLRYKRLHDLESDTEFVSKYREPVKAAEGVIGATLKKYGFNDATLKTIADEGGFAEFSRSRRTFPVQEDDPDNPGTKRTVHRSAADLAHAWLSGMAIADAEDIKASLGRQQLLKAEEKSAAQKAQAEARQYFEQQGATSKQAAELARQAQEKTAKEYSDWLAKTESETEFLKDRELPDNADEATKKEVSEHNEFNKQLRASLAKHPTTALEYGELKLKAAEAEHLRRLRGQDEARIAALESELKRARGAMKTTSKAGSILNGSGGKPPAEDAPKDPTDFRSALRKRALAMSGGDDE